MPNKDSQLMRDGSTEAREILGIIYKDRIEQIIDAQVAGSNVPAVVVSFYDEAQVDLVALALVGARAQGQLDVVEVIEEHAAKLEGNQALVADAMCEAIGRKLTTLDTRYGY